MSPQRVQTSKRAIKQGNFDRGTTYIPAIDGLRALAIIAILIYHANVVWLPGGYVGVTLFFVISGFLITASVLKEIDESGTLAYGSFIVRRFTRIWPQLICLVGFVVIVSALVAPTLLTKVRSDALPALLFFENWWFIVREVSYFAAAGSPSPITHLWFLGVLMQFYIVWPLILLLLRRIGFSKRLLVAITAVLALISTIAMVVMYDPRADTSRIYYGTDTRSAELLIGSIPAILMWEEPKRRRYASHDTNSFIQTNRSTSILYELPVAPDLLGIVALAAILVCALLLNGYSQFSYRGGLQLIALLSALLVLVLADETTLLSRIFSFPLFKGIGKRGFALYLWHYPLLLWMNPINRTEPLLWWQWLIEFVIIFMVTELSYQLFERHILKDSLKTVGEGRLPFTLTPTLVLNTTSLIAVAILMFINPDTLSTAMQNDAAATNQDLTAVAENGGAGTTITIARDEQDEVHQVMYDATGSFFEGTRFGDSFQSINLFAIRPNSDGVTQANVLLIGDSVPGACEEEFAYYFPNGHLDYKIGRQLYVGDEVYQECVEYGYGGDYIVYSLGDNGLALEEDVRTLIEVCEDRPVYLVTARLPEYIQDLNNELFKEVANQYDNVEIIDWYQESEGHPEYFWDDATHLRPEGAEAYTTMVRRAICGS